MTAQAFTTRKAGASPTSSLVQKELRTAGDYLVGRGVAKDPVQAAAWYRKAADHGNPGAQNQLGYLCLWGIGVPRDPAEAFRWFARATAGGSQAAKLNLAVMYLKGVGTSRDLSLGLDLMTQLAEKGNSRAQAYLGILLMTGTGIPRDPAAGERWLKKAAKGKNPEAEYTLGVLLSFKSDHAHDFAKAAKLFRRAAHDGYVPAMHALGLVLALHPEIAPSSPDEASVMLERAAQGGAWQASVALGALARDGRDRPRSLTEAFRWFTIAIRQGGEDARRFTTVDLDRCRHALSEEEQGRELAAADSWMQQHPHAVLFLFTGSTSSDFPIEEIYAPGSAGL
ncbi:MAG: hypothetical protein ACLGXA_14340 [Acidobacteriota bacterium]